METVSPHMVRSALEAKGLVIPPAQVVPPGTRLTYRRLVRNGDTVYVAGHGPTWGDGWGSPLGKVGKEVSVAEAVKAAELTALNILGTIERELGSLDGVACWLRVTGYVNAVEGFTDHAVVMNGFTDLLVDLYGEERLATRTTIGVQDLPFGMPVEADAIFALSDDAADTKQARPSSASQRTEDFERRELQ